MSAYPIDEGEGRSGEYKVPVENIWWLAANAAVLTVYWAVLVYTYINMISPLVGTDTFLYVRVNTAKEVEAFAWALLLLPSVNTTWTRPSDFGMTLFYFVGLVPTLILFGLSDQPRLWIYTMLAGYCATWLGCHAPVKIPRFVVRQAGRAGFIFAAVVVSIVVAWFFARGNRANFNVDLNAQYDYREAANSVFGVGPLAYMAAWVPRFLNPFILCYFLYKRNWLLVAAAFALQLFCTVIFQEKAVIIPCVILLLVYFAPSGRSARLWLILALIATIIFCAIVDSVLGIDFLTNVWTRRFFFVQQFLYFSYFEVFGKIGIVYYSDSFMRGLIHYPFPRPPSPMVAYYAWGDTLGNPNTGFLGSGYMELGGIGVILNGLVAGLVMKIFDRVTSPRVPIWFFSTVAFLPFTALLIDQNLVTSMLTSGVSILLLMMATTDLPPIGRQTRSGAIPILPAEPSQS